MNQQLPLANLRGLENSAPTEERTPAGWHWQHTGGLSADIVGMKDARICRILRSGSEIETLQTQIGNAGSALCNALYSPKEDRALVFATDNLQFECSPSGGRSFTCSGPLTLTVLDNYMKHHRSLPWFKPLDSAAFPRPIAGWCSWYYYYLEVTEEEIVKNTDWLAENLQKFGLEWVQIDDGWQGRGKGQGANRDWFVTCETDFPHGMKWNADYIRSKGFRPGIWCIPFTQSNDAMWKEQPRLFVHKEDGGSPGILEKPHDWDWATEEDKHAEWAGKYYIDATGDEGESYLTRLFEMFANEWGYDYVKIDAQEPMAGIYQTHRERLCNPSLSGDRAYRKGLQAMKNVLGPDRYLMNCGHGYSSCGICEAVRIGDDVWLEWKGMQPGIERTFQFLYLNNLAFHTDPDVVCVREPLPLEQARLWVTFTALTGQMFMASDKMYELPEERVELLRRAYPIAPILPVELYPVNYDKKPPIMVTHVNKPGVGRWAVVAVYNWQEEGDKELELTPAKLGLPAGRYVVTDFWNKTVEAEGDGVLSISLPPTSCRVFGYWPVGDRPSFAGTGRHLTQGAVDVESAQWSETHGRFSGVSYVVGGDPYVVRLHAPSGWIAEGEGVIQSGSRVELTLQRDKNETVEWSVNFRRGE